MKIFLVHPGAPLSQHDVWRGWDKALRKLGYEVGSFRTDEVLLRGGSWPPAEETIMTMRLRLKVAVLRARPDLVFFVDGAYITPEVLEFIRVPKVILHTESPYTDGNQLRLARFVDANFINDPTNLDLFAKRGPALYVPHSYDPEIHYPSHGVKDIEFTFIGTALPSRVQFFGTMNLDGVDACIDGGGWPGCLNGILNEEAAGLYRRSLMGINYYRREAEEDQDAAWSMGPREVEMAACGLPFLRDPRTEGDEVFPFLPVFHSPDEASELLREWLRDAKLRGQAEVKVLDAVRDRTFDNQAVRVMEFIKEAV